MNGKPWRSIDRERVARRDCASTRRATGHSRYSRHSGLLAARHRRGRSPVQLARLRPLWFKPHVPEVEPSRSASETIDGRRVGKLLPSPDSLALLASDDSAFCGRGKSPGGDYRSWHPGRTGTAKASVWVADEITAIDLPMAATLLHLHRMAAFEGNQREVVLSLSKTDGRRDSQPDTLMRFSADQPSVGANVIDVLDHVLDKGIVIDAWMRVSLAGIDLLTVEARVLVASIETYLQQAPAIAEVGSLPIGRLAAVDPGSGILPGLPSPTGPRQ